MNIWNELSVKCEWLSLKASFKIWQGSYKEYLKIFIFSDQNVGV